MTTRSVASPQIRHAGQQDVQLVSQVIGRTLHDLDIFGWLIPDPDRRRDRCVGYSALVVAHALRHGTVYTTRDRAAVAVWLPHDHLDIAGYQSGLSDAVGIYEERFRRLDRAMRAVRPVTPHDYLAFLAVLPHRQNSGHGGALLRHHHAVLDGQGRDAFLLAPGVRSLRLYQRHGYERSARQLGLPHGGEQMIPCWRTADR